MRVGIVSEQDVQNQLELIKECDQVVILNSENTSTHFFLDTVKEHINHEIVVPKIEDLGLQLIQLLPSLKYLTEHHRILKFQKTDELNQLSEKDYFKVLYQLALLEEGIIKKRTVEAIKRARAHGIKVGRPSISDEQAELIQTLYQKDKRTIREIAMACQVSIGTVHKYATR